MIFQLIVSACASQTSTEQTPTAHFEGELTPYLTRTPLANSPGQASESAASPTPTDIPTPTPTPVTYNVVQGDTLTSIAFRYGVKVNDLLTANPEIDPNFLTIGITLTIPTQGENPGGLPTPTPIPLAIGNPVCYPTADQGLWCLVNVENNQPFDVENISGVVQIGHPDLEGIQAQPALPPLNLLRQGEHTALAAYFPPLIPPGSIPQADILSLLPISENDTRYLKIAIDLAEPSIGAQGLQADVRGEIRLLDEERTANSIWLAAIAYDSDGLPAGIRKWEANTSLSPEAALPFEFTVFSLGPAIETVVVLGEARP